MSKRVISILLIAIFFTLSFPLETNAVICGGNRTLSAEAATEGAVLLKNNNGVLPLSSSESIAVFGSAQIDYYIGGGGSSVMFTDYDVSPLDGMQATMKVNKKVADKYREYVGERKQIQAIYGADAFKDVDSGKDYATFELKLSDELKNDAKESKTALYVISRFASEGDDVLSNEGGFLLTNDERDILKFMSESFEKTIVVLNIACAIDTSFIDEYDIDAALVIWYAGSETGNVLADLLTGSKNPSGKLTVTYADKYESYYSSRNFDNVNTVLYEEDIFVGYRQFETFDPDYTTVNFCFGHGLSYTSFAMYDIETSCSESEIIVRLKVGNTGTKAGKEVIQLYYSAPQGVLGNPSKELAGFAKTSLLSPATSEIVEIRFDIADMASYDDTGKICKSAYILEKGDYKLYLGNSIRDAGSREPIFIYECKENKTVSQLTERCPSTKLSGRLCADGTMEALSRRSTEQDEQKIPGRINNAEKPSDTIRLVDVYNDNTLMDSFLAQLSIEEMAKIAGGQTSTVGYAAGGVFGDVLSKYGVPTISVTDGTHGVRVDTLATYFPSGICVASTWNTALAEKVGSGVGKECQRSKIDMWLAPGLNIIRNPLCGRNFEYCSEDPLLSGMISGAVTRGVQSEDIAVCLKHYLANNKEKNRGPCDSQLSERALREIYLKSFEVSIKEGNPWAIMSTCGTVNGTGAAGNYDLMYALLREELNFDGIVMSDWANMDGEVEELWAGHNIGMPANTPSALVEAYEKGLVTREMLEWNTEQLMKLEMRLYTFKISYAKEIKAGTKETVTPTTKTTSAGTQKTQTTAQNEEEKEEDEKSNGALIAIVACVACAMISVIVLSKKKSKT